MKLRYAARLSSIRHTNNTAECEGLLLGLRKAKALRAKRIIINTDSEPIMVTMTSIKGRATRSWLNTSGKYGPWKGTSLVLQSNPSEGSETKRLMSWRRQPPTYPRYWQTYYTKCRTTSPSCQLGRSCTSVPFTVMTGEPRSQLTFKGTLSPQTRKRARE